MQELLEGETLRSALAGGKLSPRKAIDYALQIAHGLAAAHEKGIVHRDLKPENLFVTKDGRVKILDFGLAKLTHQEEGGQAHEPADGLGGHGAGRRAGHARLHVARAGEGQVRRRPVGHLLLRRHPLRDALGKESVPRRLGGRDDVGDPPGRAAGPLRHEPEHLARASSGSSGTASRRTRSSGFIRRTTSRSPSKRCRAFRRRAWRLRQPSPQAGSAGSFRRRLPCSSPVRPQRPM